MEPKLHLQRASENLESRELTRCLCSILLFLLSPRLIKSAEPEKKIHRSFTKNSSFLATILQVRIACRPDRTMVASPLAWWRQRGVPLQPAARKGSRGRYRRGGRPWRRDVKAGRREIPGWGESEARKGRFYRRGYVCFCNNGSHWSSGWASDREIRNCGNTRLRSNCSLLLR